MKQDDYRDIMTEMGPPSLVPPGQRSTLKFDPYRSDDFEAPETTRSYPSAVIPLVIGCGALLIMGFAIHPLLPIGLVAVALVAAIWRGEP